MPATNRGVGVIWGVTSSNPVAGSGVLRQTGRDFNYAISKVDHTDRDGSVVGCTVFDGLKNLTLDVYPAGTSNAQAADAVANAPTPGSTMTITDSTDAIVAGTYLVTAVSRRQSNSEKYLFTVTLEKYDGASYSTIS